VLVIYAGLGPVILVIMRQMITMVDKLKLLKKFRESQVQLEYRASHDSLTGLVNRVVLLDRLNSAIAMREREHGALVLLFVDIDRFKAINDSYGHRVGDMVLRTVGQRLKSCVRASDTVARLSGDEFAVLCDGVSSSPEQIRSRVLAALEVPHSVDGYELIVRASIGTVRLTSFVPDLTADELLSRADAAMYSAKRCGNGTVVAGGTVVAAAQHPAVLADLIGPQATDEPSLDGIPASRAQITETA
jgi:diguanylate cyclase (GGDEF)-like protein